MMVIMRYMRLQINVLTKTKNSSNHLRRLLKQDRIPGVKIICSIVRIKTGRVRPILIDRIHYESVDEVLANRLAKNKNAVYRNISNRSKPGWGKRHCF